MFNGIQCLSLRISKTLCIILDTNVHKIHSYQPQSTRRGSYGINNYIEGYNHFSLQKIVKIVLGIAEGKHTF